MGLLTRMRAAAWAFRNASGNTISTAQSVEKVFRELFMGSPTSAGESVSEETALRAATVYACVRVLAESVSHLPIKVYRWLPDGRRQKAYDHAVFRLMNVAPNAAQTPMGFREQMIAHLCLRGQFLAIKSGMGGRIGELTPVMPDRYRVVADSRQGRRILLSNDTAGETELDPARAFYVMGLSMDGVKPVTPITAYREAVGLNVAALKHQARSFGNGAKFLGYLKRPADAPELSEDARRRLRESFDASHSGENAFKTPLLEEGTEFVQTSMTAEDAATIETLKLSDLQICKIFRVPPHKVGILDRATFSNIEHQSIEFVTDSITPWSTRIEQAIARDLFTPRERETHYAKHVVDALLRGDTLSRYQAHGQSIKDGWRNRNEVRDMEDLDPVEGLDEYLYPLNMGRSNDASQQQGQATGNAGAR